MKQPLKRSVVERATKQSLAFIAATCLLAGCGDSDKDPGVAGGSVEDQEIIAEEIIPIENKTISGVSQKGPFVNGSSVTVQELEGKTLAQTGRSYEGKIKNDRGEFSVNVVNLESQFALLKANGFYRNEVTGEQSKSQVTLYALTDLSDRDKVNVNLLTHLEYERSLNLATSEGTTIAKAKKQTEKEIFATFGIDGDFESSEDLNIFGSGDGSAALLAISMLMQGDLKEADFSKRLADYATDIETDGKWDDEKAKTAIADWAAKTSLKGGLAGIRKNIESWELSDKVPAFEKFVDNFWWENYELGACSSKREGEIQKNGNPESELKDMKFICLDGAWMEATDFAKDTHSWDAGKEGEARYGDSVTTNCYVFEDGSWRDANSSDCNLELGGCTEARQDTVGMGCDKVWYICKDNSWEEASTMKKDTYGWKDATEGDIKKGNVTDTVYVFKAKKWSVADDIEAVLGGCVKATADSVGKADSTWYICKEGEWTKAKQIEYDTYRWEAGEDGDTRQGDVHSSVCYVYDGDAWREGNGWDCSLGLDGCTKARLGEKKLAENEEWYVCTDISGAGNYSWKIKYAPAGTCAPSKNSVYKGETVTWTFTITNPASASATELMEYTTLVKNSTCEWTTTGSDPASASGKCGSDGKTATATYTKIGSYTADLKIGEKTISCGSVQVVPAPLTGCKCEASETTPDVGDGDVTVTWNVSGCNALADITSYTWTGITGDGDTATMTFTEKGQTASPTVQVADSEKQVVNLACPAVRSVNSSAPDYVDP
jgi:plastocyanin/major membrane immunogen (membrane-anchored lipoprotein)